MDRARRKGGFVAGEVEDQRRYFLGAAEPAHRLPRHEGGLRGVIVAGVMQPLLQRGRIDRARADAVAANALPHEIRGDRLGEANDARLARAIGEAVGDALHRTRDRGHVDDGARALVQHAGQEGADAVIHGGHVEREREIPLILAAFQDIAGMDHAGDVREYVDRADLLRQRAHRGAIGHVERAPLAALQPVERRQVAVGRDHISVKRCK